jgi:dipeptidyl aminopeptidase/acylaminoacyl peptidase
MERLPVYGFRLMKEIEPSAPASFARVERTFRDTASESPVDDAGFAIFKRLFDYDPLPLSAQIETSEQTPAWKKETVSYAAPQGNERITAYLYLPVNARPPYQTVLYFPGGDSQMLRSSRNLRLRLVDFVIRSGRAVLFPVYKGTYERGVTVSGPYQLRTLAIDRIKEMRRSLDYLTSRPDVAHDKLGFYGVSLGATMGVLFTAVEPRIKATVLMGTGLPGFKPLPEIDGLNYAPRVQAPTLMVNGRADFAYDYETMQIPLFRLLGAPEKEHATFEGGHIPVRIHDVIGRIVDWFDKYLGGIQPAAGR